MKFSLNITADLQNLKYLDPEGGFDDPNFTYYVKLKCSGCGEVTPQAAWLSFRETVPIPKSRGTANLVMKCKFCEREGSVTLLPERGYMLRSLLPGARSLNPLMRFDCRGFDPVEFNFGSGWQAESIVGTIFNEIDLSDGEFAEYDEKGKFPVKIRNLRYVFKTES